MQTAKIYINGIIGIDTTLVDIISQYEKQKDAQNVIVMIDSIGGICDDGYDMFNYLRSIGKPITTIASNQCKSIATVVFMAGSTRKIQSNCSFLIHLPMMEIAGLLNSTDLNECNELILVEENKLVTFYKKETNLNADAILPLLKNETTLSPQTAVDLGFATQILEPQNKPVALYGKLSNNKKDVNMSPEDKSWFEKLFNKVAPTAKKGFNVKALNKGKIVNVDVTDANGVIISFPDVADGIMPMVNDKATIDGQPANGEYITPSGDTMVFVDGVLTQVIEPETATDDGLVDVLTSENEKLKADLLELTQNLFNIKKEFQTHFNVEKIDVIEPKEVPTKRNLFKAK